MADMKRRVRENIPVAPNHRIVRADQDTALFTFGKPHRFIVQMRRGIVLSTTRARVWLGAAGKSTSRRVHVAGRANKDRGSCALDASRSLKTDILAGAVEQVCDRVSKAGEELVDSTRDVVDSTVSAARHKLADIAILGVDFRERIKEAVEEKVKDFADVVTYRLSDSEEFKKRFKEAAIAVGVATATAYGKILAVMPKFTELSPVLKAKIAMAGGHGTWSPLPIASEMFESTIPFSIRNLGESAVWKFVEGKHASHIESVHNAPALAMEPTNIVWESAKANLARGASDMTALELAKANIANLVDAAGIVVVDAIHTAAIAGCVGMALEAVVSLGENVIYVYGGKRSVGEAAADIGKKMLKTGGAAAIGGGIVSVALALGAGPALSATAPVLVIIGGTVYVVGAYQRIKTALDSREEHAALVPALLQEKGSASGLAVADPQRGG